MAKRSVKANKNSQQGRLRIVAGIWRSRHLDIADVPGLRPTSERIRETLFNWLSPSIAGAQCLDLFAGTGALGLEALSRGAESVVFVEKSATAATALRTSIAALEADATTVHEMDAFDFLSTADGGVFDLVFLDPPFADDTLDDLCKLLQKKSILAAGAMVYVEEDRRRPEIELPDEWQVLKIKKAGNVRYSLVKLKATS